jgi:NAD(P)H-dependent flavin oxidoreductase YrpB (nitropropane dioxygenase family)
MSTIPSVATRFTQRFGVPHPFACAGMAFAALTPDLAIAVSKAGGIGAIGVGFTPPQLLREYIRAVKAATPSPFNVNFITCFDNDARMKVCAEEGLPIVSWRCGHPSAENRRIMREAGVSYWEQVGSVDDAARAVDSGAEVVIAQGYEPAATTTRGGPASRVCRRSCYCRPWLRRILAAKGEDTVFSRIFGPEWPHFNPMRLQRNRVVAAPCRGADGTRRTRTRGQDGALGQPMELRKFNALLPAPQTEADWEEMPWPMGQGVGLVNDIRPAGEVVEQTMSEAQQTILGRLGRSLSRSGDATSRRAMA